MSGTQDTFEQPAFGPPRAISGFTHINRYWDRTHGLYAAKILPGQFYVTYAGEMITTVLGSCISACVRDPVAGIAGMNHFMLPLQHNTSERVGVMTGEAARYGNWAMEYLINEVLKCGGRKSRLEVKVFGGGKVLDSLRQTDIGYRNIVFVRTYLEQEGLPLAAEDVGGPWPRKILYFADSGKVKLRRLRNLHNDTILTREQQYAHSLDKQPVQGDVELF
jgi:chemotaxis protein CheD